MSYYVNEPSGMRSAKRSYKEQAGITLRDNSVLALRVFC